MPKPTDSKSTLSIIAASLGISLVLAAAGVAYLRTRRSHKSRLADAMKTAKSSSIPSFRFKQKSTLNTAIKVLENDLSRKALIIGLKAAAKRLG